VFQTLAGRITAALSFGLMVVPFAPVALPPVAEDPHLIPHEGEWSLAALGYADTELFTDSRRVDFTYALPDGVTQGPSDWFHLKMDADITFAENAPGRIYLGASTDDAACAQIVFDLARWANDKLIDWHTVDLVHGQTNFQSNSDTIHVQFENYMRDQGIAAGAHTLSFWIQGDGSSEAVVAARLRATTAIVWDHDNPEDIRLSVKEPEDTIVAGKPFSVAYEVENVDALPAEALEIAAFNVGESPVTILTPPTSIAELRDRTSGAIDVVVPTAGRFSLEVRVQGKDRNDRASAVIDGDAGVARARPNQLWFWAVLFLAFLIGSVLAIRPLRSRTKV
jgi:hypothetical protein